MVVPPKVVERPSHDELESMLKEIGEMLGFIVKTEEPSPDGAYRHDVTWRDYESHAPVKVFEIEVSGQIDHALSSLTHAYDMGWGRERLYLIVEDEADALRAQKLAIPRTKGTFARIRDRLTVLPWTDVKKLYEAMNPHGELLKELSERS